MRGHNPHDKAYVDGSQTTLSSSSKMECNTYDYKCERIHSPQKCYPGEDKDRKVSPMSAEEDKLSSIVHSKCELSRRSKKDQVPSPM